MASFKEICFTPAEFATLAKIDRNLIPTLEDSGLLRTVKRRIGNVDRKMVMLEDMQNYFRMIRSTSGRLRKDCCHSQLRTWRRKV